MSEHSLSRDCILILIIFVNCSKSGTNIALNKPAKSIEGYTNRANDGNSATNWNSNSCFNVGVVDTTGYWWQIDFEAVYLIKEVRITNRGDCCPDRLSDFSLDVFDANPEIDPFTPPKNCNFYPGTVASGATVSIECIQEVWGRFLRITRASGALHFCEVQVFTDEGVRFQRYGLFTQNKEKRSNSSTVTIPGLEATNRIECAEHCIRSIECTGFNFRFLPEVSCQPLQDSDGGALIIDAAWDFYLMKEYWKRCD